MAYDIQATTITSTNTAVNKRVRLKGLSYVTGGTVGSLVVRDGGAGGTTVLTLNTPATTDIYDLMIPDNGILCATNVHITVSNVTSVTVLYEG